MKRLTSRQEEAISILIATDESSVTQSYTFAGHPEELGITDGGDYLELHVGTFKWLCKIGALADPIHPNSLIDVYYPTKKCKQIAEEHNIKPYDSCLQ